ncbi:MAG TPA: glucokinase [Acidiphilium sp.]|nr:glucokinase [Acidiphilium sp.]
MEETLEIVVADIGGTYARFARAQLHAGKVASFSSPVTLQTNDFASLRLCWEAFARSQDTPLPKDASIAVASPVSGDVVKLTNSSWLIQPAHLRDELGLDTIILLNDFSAVGHAVAHLPPEGFSHLTGPGRPLPESGVISVIGPGTGLGVSHILREAGQTFIVSGEGGHIDFAPLDRFEDYLLTRLRSRYPRVSIERVVSGPGLSNIYQSLAEMERYPVRFTDDRLLWNSALSGADSLAAAALARFCQCLGAVAGDLALAHGAGAVVIAGGIGARLAGYLPKSGFAARFAAKGRFEQIMADMPVKLLIHPQPGLYGAAMAFLAASWSTTAKLRQDRR